MSDFSICFSIFRFCLSSLRYLPSSQQRRRTLRTIELQSPPLHPADTPPLENASTKQLHANRKSSKPPKTVSGSRSSHPNQRRANAFQGLLEQKEGCRQALKLSDPKTQSSRVCALSRNAVPVILPFYADASTRADGAQSRRGFPRVVAPRVPTVSFPVIVLFFFHREDPLSLLFINSASAAGAR